MKIRTLTGSKCIICDENIKQGIILHKTRRQTHSLCEECMIHYITPILKQKCNNLRENIRHNIEYIDCPGTFHSEHRNRCKTKIYLRNLDIDDKSPVYLDFIRILFMSSNNNIHMCKKVSCSQLIEILPDYRELKIRCDICDTTWCRECSISPFHDNISCTQHEINLQNTENGKYLKIMSDKGQLKFCPQCKSPTIKNNGCNKMCCVYCNVKWCWLCLDINIDYEHYNEKNKKACANRLWK